MWRNNSPARTLQWVCLLCLSTGLLGCTPEPAPDPPSCLVKRGGPIEPPTSGPLPSPDSLAQSGPHPTWSTQPHPSCNENPRVQAASADTELELLITYPAATNPLETGYADIAPGKWPVVLFGHANTYADCHLVDAYTTLHQRWASWGFIVVSVDASDLCVKNSKANLEGRRDDLFAAWASIGQPGEQPEHLLYGHVDTEKLVLAGHSRGATAALLATQQLVEADGLIWLQGVDTGGYQLGRPSVTVPALGIVAGLDRDIRFPKAEPTREQLVGPHAWATLLGGIHAFTSDRIPARKKTLQA